MKSVEDDLFDESAKTRGKKQPPAALPKRARTPRKAEDLRAQREHEGSWNRHHCTVFSRFNHKFHPNYRSYFDRWKDDTGGGNDPNPSWRLGVERKPLGYMNRSMSQPDPLKDRGGLPGQAAWVSNF